MKYLYPVIAALLLSACAAQQRQPDPIGIDTAKYPLDPEAFGVDAFISDDARENYREYSERSFHKAFAQSKSGAWGWWANSDSAEYAMLDALFQCRQNNVVNEIDEPCLIVNVNGYWGAGLF